MCVRSVVSFSVLDVDIAEVNLSVEIDSSELAELVELQVRIAQSARFATRGSNTTNIYRGKPANADSVWNARFPTSTCASMSTVRPSHGSSVRSITMLPRSSS